MKKKILVVDDEVDILTIVEIILKRKGLIVETLSKWEKIPETIASFNPDLILLDVSLGGADGREICRDLKSDRQTEDIPIILFSAHYKLIYNLKDCKPNAIISKPFDSNYLVDTVIKHLNLSATTINNDYH